MNKQIFTLKNLSLTALLTALVFSLTAFFQIPLAIGYFNFGDIVILFASIFFHPILGAISGSLGAALGDLYGGYFYFIPFTLLAKAGEALIAGYLFLKFPNKKTPWLFILLGSIFMVLVYAGSYLIFDLTGGLLLASTPFDFFQALISTVFATGLYYYLKPYRDNIIY